MGAITDLSDLVNLFTGGGSANPQVIPFFKDSRVDSAAAQATVAGRYTSLWRYEGSHAGAPVPTTVAAPDNTTDGGLKQTDPGGGRQLWLVGANASCAVLGTLILYDRLLHIGGLSGTSTSAQTVGGTLGRYTGAESAGNQIWVEINTAIGATGTTITASYTDQDGNTGSTSVAANIGSTGLNEAQRIIPLPLAQGDTGVEAVASVTLTATTGTAGNFGVVVARPLAFIEIGVAGAGAIRSFLTDRPGPVEIKTDACLALAWLANGTTAPRLMGQISLVEK